MRGKDRHLPASSFSRIITGIGRMAIHGNAANVSAIADGAGKAGAAAHPAFNPPAIAIAANGID